MRRKILLLHLILAAFMAPAFIMVAVSGGLYLFGVKGSNFKSSVPISNQFSIDLSSGELEDDVRALIQQLALNVDFEYIKTRGSTIVTRPTSREFLELKVTGKGLKIWRVSPDLQSSLIELHKGHGPLAFKTYQQLVAVGLIFVMLSGLWMGLSNRTLRKKTIVAMGLGLVIFVLLAFS